MGKSTISMAIFNSYVSLPEDMDVRNSTVNGEWLEAIGVWDMGIRWEVAKPISNITSIFSFGGDRPKVRFSQIYETLSLKIHLAHD